MREFSHKGSPGEQALAILSLVVLPLSFDLMAPLRAFLIAFLLLAMFLRWRQIYFYGWRFRFIFLLPAMCFLSALWSGFPEQTLKFSIYMVITIAVCLYIASRITPQQLVTSILAACGIIGVFSLLMPNIETLGDGTVAARGILPHKNVLGVRSFLLITAAVTVVLNRSYHTYWRLFGLLMIPVALILLALSKSATAILLSVFGVTVLVFVNGMWRQFSARAGGRGLLLALVMIFTALGGLMMANMWRVDPASEILDSVGKDRSITGRTDIWAMGNGVIRDNPFLGVGANAFWQPSVNQATIISLQFHAEDNKFFFHNAYYEVMVHLGLVGFGVFVFVYGRIFVEILLSRRRDHRQNDGFVPAIALAILIRSFIESELFSVLLLLPMLLLIMYFQRQMHG